MPAGDIRPIFLLGLAAALGTASDARADDTALEAFASRIGIIVAPAGPADVLRPAPAARAEPSALDAFVSQVGFDITRSPRELRAEWVDSSRGGSMPHAMFCAVHGARTARYEWEARALRAMRRSTRMSRLEPK